MPTPIIRILLAGGRTAKVEHSAIRILLAMFDFFGPCLRGHDSAGLLAFEALRLTEACPRHEGGDSNLYNNLVGVLSND